MLKSLIAIKLCLMKLQSITIENFRSIISIKDLDLSNPVTVFVGANEHGKSNILKAISNLSGGALSEEDCRKNEESEVFAPSITYKLLFSDEDQVVINKELSLVVPAGEEVPAPATVLYTKYLKEESEGVFRAFYKVEPSISANDIIYEYIKKVAAKKVIYFDEFTNKLTSKITQAEIDDPENTIVAGLLKIAGLGDAKATLFSDTSRMRHLADVASQKATDDIRTAWRQGKEDDISLTIGRDTAARSINVDVHDRNSYVEFQSRSRGFQWFLSFYLSYRAQHDGDIESSSSLFIMDEPGLFLHPKGQKDLLLYLEKLGNNNQVIYSTHSPFMINRLEPNSVKVVVKTQKDGTIVNVKGYSSNWRPLRTSLGMVLSDSFYFADNTLVAEGVEDQIYITALLQFFYSQGITPNIDVNLLSIVAAGGASEVPAMTRIVLDEDRPTAVLIDSDRPQEYKRLQKFDELNTDDKLKQVKDFGDDKTYTIQDLLPRKLYVDAVNSFIEILVNDGTLISTKKIPDFFSLNRKGKADKQVDEHVNVEYGVESISKVGIARHFEDLLKQAKYNQKDFAKAEAMIKWVVNTLGLAAEK